MSPRIYTDQPLANGSTVTLDPNPSAHLIKVLRLAEGSAVELFNGDGNSYAAIITSASKRAELCIETSQPGPSPSPVRITLVQGISRGDRMDFSIQKAVELGVHAVQPVFTEKSKVRLDGARLEKKHQHWKAIGISASEQSGRCDLPEILEPIQLATLLKSSPEHPSLLLAFGDFPSLAKAATADKTAHVSLLIGPESGLSDTEIDQAIAVGWQPCQLGPRILRTETAAVTAVALVQYAAGDLQKPPC